ncbi:MAG TPA: response regulator transcription factor [Amycolatopsis sp.]|uniref:response regulator transcription factor n=1 Tax=Amycolatopsis sp. TaxID=37632 RepID=UPI002B459AC6|nr:response regulator transcription factor [Amycolatopsis sp.]HKS46590.1 response regulator transcription factor [Amycolatopsis sp.]
MGSDPDEACAVTELFRRHGFEVWRVDDGRAAVTAAHTADLVVLDMGLPDLDGLEVCRRIRIRGAVPIIATSREGTGLDLVTGLRAGLDAYLIHPYGRRELVARAEAILRRTGACRSAVITCGPLRINPPTREVVAYGRRVVLTLKEFELLWLLAADPDMVFRRRQIMSAVWHDEWGGSSRTIDTHVSSLRRKLGDPAAITTVRGVGFRIGYSSTRPERPVRAERILDIVLT